MSDHLCAVDRECDGCRALLRHRRHRSAASFWYLRAFRSSVVTAQGACGSRARRRGRQFFRYLDVSLASLSVLLVALIGRVLFDVALAALFGKVFRGAGLGILRRLVPV